MSKRLSVFVLAALGLFLSVSPVAAQTYFPFGAVVVGTPSSGVRVGPFGCYVSTDQPTYTTSQIHPCSMTVDGRMRVDPGTVNVTPALDAVFEVTVIGGDPGGDPIPVTLENGGATNTDDGDVPDATANAAHAIASIYEYNGTTLIRRFSDPCASVDKTTTPFSVTTDTVIISAAASKKNYICSIVFAMATAEIVSFTEGTGSVCATSEAALAGSTTDASGMPFGANGGLGLSGGSSTLIAGKTANVDTCLNVSGSNRVAGFVTWVQR